MDELNPKKGQLHQMYQSDKALQTRNIYKSAKTVKMNLKGESFESLPRKDTTNMLTGASDGGHHQQQTHPTRISPDRIDIEPNHVGEYFEMDEIQPAVGNFKSGISKMTQ